MHLLDMDSPEDRAVLVSLVTSALAKDRSRVVHQFATVVGYSKAPTQTLPVAVIHLDGDPQDVARQAVNLLPTPPGVGDRVRVEFDPPSGINIIGTVDDRAAGCYLANFEFDATVGWGAETRQPLLGTDDDTHTLNCGFELIDGNTSGSLNTLVVPTDGIYLVSAGVLLTSAHTGQDDYEMYVEAGATKVVTFDVASVPDTVTTISLQARARPIYANAGDELHVEGAASETATIEGDYGAGLSVWAVCCDYVPGEDEGGGGG